MLFRSGLDDLDGHPFENRPDGIVHASFAARGASVQYRHLRAAGIGKGEIAAPREYLPERNGRNAVVKCSKTTVTTRTYVDDLRAWGKIGLMPTA